jgi:hypothetical protein
MTDDTTNDVSDEVVVKELNTSRKRKSSKVVETE